MISIKIKNQSKIVRRKKPNQSQNANPNQSRGLLRGRSTLKDIVLRIFSKFTNSTKIVLTLPSAGAEMDIPQQVA